MEIARGTRELEGGDEEGEGGITRFPSKGSPAEFAWVDWELTSVAEGRGGGGEAERHHQHTRQRKALLAGAYFWRRRIFTALLFSASILYDASFANLNNTSMWME